MHVGGNYGFHRMFVVVVSVILVSNQPGEFFFYIFLLSNSFCMTDMYDDWEDDPDNLFEYRHQRRLSDPSANLNNFSRSGWKTKAPAANEHSSKAMSQNEGLDSLANEVSEIEAGDLKDGKCAFDRVTLPNHPPPLNTEH